MYFSWKARSKIVSRGPGGEPESSSAAGESGGSEPRLSRTVRAGECKTDERPCADVQPNSSASVSLGAENSCGRMEA